MQQFTHVNQSIRKTDSMQLLLGKPLFMDDIVPKDALIVKLLRSPYAHAIVKEIDTSRAKKCGRDSGYLHLAGCTKFALH